MGLSPPAGGAPSPGRPAMRGAHRLPIGEDGEEGDQRKTDGFPLDSFPLMTGAVSRRIGDSAGALCEDRRLSDFPGAHCFAPAQTVVQTTVACGRTGRRRGLQTFVEALTSYE